MPLSPEDYADQEDNILFRSIKIKDWDNVREFIGLIGRRAEEKQEKKKKNSGTTKEEDTGGGDNGSASTAQQSAELGRRCLIIEERDIYNNTALHAALGYQAPDDIILHLLQVHPDAAKVHGSNDWLPLHIAAMYGCSSNVMTALILTYPEGLDDRGEGEGGSSIKGRTPRHFQNRFPHNRSLLAQTTEEWRTERSRRSNNNSNNNNKKNTS